MTTVDLTLRVITKGDIEREIPDDKHAKDLFLNDVEDLEKIIHNYILSWDKSYPSESVFVQFIDAKIVDTTKEVKNDRF